MTRQVAALLLLLSATAMSQTPGSLLTDEQARAAAIERAKQTSNPSVCREPSREEEYETSVFYLIPDKIRNGELNHPVFFYEISNSFCYEVVANDELLIHAIDHGGVIGVAAVNRADGKTYWFDYTDQSAAEFARLMQAIRPVIRDVYHAQRVADLYRRLVHQPAGSDVLWELDLKHKAENNFSSAWSPYEKDRAWERRFDRWWRALRAARPKLDYEVREKREGTAFLVTGLAFRGYPLTIPSRDPPPKGTPSVVRWRLLVHADGTVEDKGTETVFQYKP